MKPPFTRITALLGVSVLSLSALANGKGNGGIDVLTRDGRHVPIESYIATHSRPVNDICRIPDVEPGYGNTEEWKTALNNVGAALGKAVPGAGIMLSESIKDTEFAMLDLEEGDRLTFTGDDGNVIDTNKVNGAVRIPGQRVVYLLTSNWRSYWTGRDHSSTVPDRQYRDMLVRVIHEALLPNYSENDMGKFNLGRAVVEILRLSDIFPKNQASTKGSLLGKTPSEGAKLLRQYGLSFAGRYAIPSYPDKWSYLVDSGFNFKFLTTKHETIERVGSYDENQMSFFKARYERMLTRFEKYSGAFNLDQEGRIWTYDPEVVLNSGIIQDLRGVSHLYVQEYTAFGSSISRKEVFSDLEGALKDAIAKSTRICE